MVVKATTIASSTEAPIAFADAASALAGHQITDPFVRELMNRVARGDMRGDQAVAALRQHAQG